MKRKFEDIKIRKIKKKLDNSNININIKSIKKKKFSSKKRSKTPHLPKNKNESSNILVFIFIISILVGLIFWSSILFENAEIIISKKHQTFNLDKLEIDANKGLDVKIPFEIMIISDNKLENIKLSESEKLSIKAHGNIIFYNEYSKNKEKISSKTYLSDEDGKVYLTDNTIIIPGYSTKNGKVIPGKAKVGVTSFLSGDVYNGSPESFTINAFKGTSKYKKIYAKAVSPIIGGIQGISYSLNNDDILKINKIANSSFKNQLIEKVNSLIPENYIFYKDASKFSYKIEKKVQSKIPNADVLISGELSAVILDKNKLSKQIIKTLLPEISKEELKTIEISNIDKLQFNFSMEDQEINKDIKLINFILSGDLDLIWNSNIIKNKIKLLGISKEELSIIFKNDIGIQNATVKIFPPWKSILPTNISKIKITIY